jgi:hypothetical protein
VIKKQYAIDEDLEKGKIANYRRHSIIRGGMSKSDRTRGLTQAVQR